MEKKYEEIRDKVLKGTKRALEKLKEQSKKEGRALVITDKINIKKL
jgi:hypothetical protein